MRKYQAGTGEEGILPRFETRNGIMYMITKDNPYGLVVGEVPVSGTDPVGELVVEGAVLGKPFELGLKGLGLLGKAGWSGLSKVAPKVTTAVETGINSTKTAIKKLNPKNYFNKSELKTAEFETENLPKVILRETSEKDIQGGFKDVIKYYKSPEYKNKLLQQGYTETEAEETINTLIQNLGKSSNGKIDGLNLISIEDIKNPDPLKRTNGKYVQGYYLRKISPRQVIVNSVTPYPRGTARHEFFHASSLQLQADADIVPPNWVTKALMRNTIKEQQPILIKLIEHDSKILNQFKVPNANVTAQEARSLALESEIEANLLSKQLQIPASDVFKLSDDTLSRYGVTNLMKIKKIFGNNAEEAVKRFIVGTGVTNTAASSVKNEKSGGKLNYLNYINNDNRRN